MLGGLHRQLCSQNHVMFKELQIIYYMCALVMCLIQMGSVHE